MIKAKILKNGIEKNAAPFATQAAAEAWVNLESLRGSFGKLDRWMKESEFTTETIPQSIESRVVNILGELVTEYRFPQEFIIEYVDISAQVVATNAKALRARKRAFGESLIDDISNINEAKTLNVDAFMDDPLIISLREHLYAGNITTFINKLQASNVTAYFTNAEKQSVIDACNSFLNSLGGN